MVFQSALSYILNKYLGEFVENLDTKQLNVGIWGGDIELKDLVLKPAALDELDLPVQTVYGKIGKLVLKIPWKSLYTSRTVITVEDVYLLAQPNQMVRYDPLKEDQKVIDYKRKQIENIEEIKKIAADKASGKAPPKQGWTAEFAEKLVATIIKNIQLNIKHIHIRYEDKITNSKSPFSFGITLDEFIVESTDANWKPAISDDIVKIYKILHLDNLAVYENCKSIMYGELQIPRMLEKLKNGIATKTNKAEKYTYILGPINASARLVMNQKPDQDDPPYSIPKFNINLQMETLFVGLNKCQYHDLIALAESMGRMERGMPYRKFRPNLTTYKGHYKEWWNFAIEAVLEGEVRRRRRNWDWNHIKEYRDMCREYKELYIKKANNKTLKGPDEERMTECEKILDLTNLIIIREEAQVEARRESTNSEKKGWLSWMWGGSSESKENLQQGELISKFKQEMTPAEKAQMFEAIGYQENAAPVMYPEGYVDITAKFLLKSFLFELYDVDKKSDLIPVLTCNLQTVKCKVNTRPAVSGLTAQVIMDDFSVTGCVKDEFTPHLISSETLAQKDLLDILFEINPEDKSCDQRIHVKAQPLQIIYDANTINKLVDVFSIPPDSEVSEIQDAASSKITEIREMSALGLQYTIENRQTLDVNIDLKAPKLILPYGGLFTGHENVIIVDLGNVKLYSEGSRLTRLDNKLQREKDKDPEEFLKFMQGNCYDKFKLELTRIQILVAQSEENWRKCLDEDTSTNMHLLHPLTLAISYEKCLITDDPRLPHNKILGEIPSIDISVSDARLMLAIALIGSITFPGAGEQTVPLTRYASTQSLRASTTTLNRYLALQTVEQKKPVADDTEEEQVQFTILVASFVMKTLAVTINKQESISERESELASFKIDTIQCQMKQQTYTTSVELDLGGIELQADRLGEKINLVEIPVEDSTLTKQSLFKLKFIQVNPKYRDIHSAYKSCESNLTLNFAILHVILHQEALLELMKFGQDIQDQMLVANQDKLQNFRTASTKLERSISSSSMISKSLLKLTDIQPKKKKMKKLKIETIKFRLSAALQEVSVKFRTDFREICKASISGVNTVIIVKETYTQINAALVDLCVLDLNRHSVHKQIMLRTGGHALMAQIVMNNIEHDDTETDLPDMDVKIELGQMRIIFMNCFIINMLNFLNKFQEAQQTIANASAAAAEVAKGNMLEAYEKATKIAMDIELKAPLILIPTNSKSYEMLCLDMGVLNITNTFLTLDIKNDDGYPAVVDDMSIVLSNLKISRTTSDKTYTPEQEWIILEPSTVNFNCKRNLSTSWYNAIPDIDIFGKIPSIRIVFSNVDYQGVMAILQGNLSEGKAVAKEAPPAKIEIESKTIFDTATSKAEVAKEMWLASKKEKPHIFLKFTFFMDKFVISLYYKENATLQTDFKRSSEYNFARLSLEGLSLKGKIMTDESIVTSILLLNCILDDTRPNREDKLNRLIDRSPEKTVSGQDVPQTYTGSKSMIDVTYQQRGEDSFTQEETDTANQALGPVPSAYALSVSPSQKTIKPKEIPRSSGQMTLNLKLEKPDIILVEHMDHIDAKAIILTGEILVKLRQSGDHQVINGVIKDLELYRSLYNPVYRLGSKSTILYPVVISLAGSTPPEQGLHVELLITNVYIVVSPSTLELTNKVLLTIGTDSSTNQEEEKEFNHENLWKYKSFKQNDYWFLKTEMGTEVVESIEEPEEIKPVLQELCIVSVPTVTIAVEVGFDCKALPVLILETGFKGTVRNWSTLLEIEASLTMQMGYFNHKLAMWELIIEPEVVNEQLQLPWELKCEVKYYQDQNLDNSATSAAASSESTADSVPEIELPPPQMTVEVSSQKNLEITITKTLLETVEYLQKAFGTALEKDHIVPVCENGSPFKIVNELGEDIALVLEESCFTKFGSALGDINKGAIPLQLKPQYRGEEKLYLSTELKKNKDHNVNTVKVQIPGLDSTLTLPVDRADKRYFPLNYRTNFHDCWGIISDVSVADAVTTIVLRSTVQVHNHFDVPIDVFYMTSKGNELKSISQIKPGEKLNIPLDAVYTPTTELFFGVADYTVTAKSFPWKALQTNIKISKKLHCYPKNQDKENVPFCIQVVGEMEQVYFQDSNRHTMNSTCYNIHLRPAITFKNCLPLTVVCCVDESPDEFTVEPGDTLQLPTVDPGKNYLVIRIPKYLDKEWSVRKEISHDPDEFTVWTFNSYDSATKLSLDLGMHIEKNTDSLILTLYCPFWMINKTGLMLTYRKTKKAEKVDTTSSPQSSDDNVNILYHPADFEGPILFSFNAKHFFGKKKASIRIDNGEWSDKFSIDVAGSSGIVNCKLDNYIYQIGVQNQLTYNSLTKQITFTPYYVIINEAPFAIECQENSRPADPWVVVPPKSCSPLWPKDENVDKLMKIRVKGTTQHSAPFLFTESHTTLLKLNNKYGGVNVDIQLTEGGIFINIAPYEDGSAPALLLNYTSYVISYWEKESIQKRILEPSSSILYTWENPSGPRAIVWDRGHKKEIINDLRKDMYGEFSPKDGVYIYWTTFLDGMQRILLFTHERCLAEAAQASNLLEVAQQEITVSIHGIGLSLVNNVTRQEILYVGIASSGIIWEASKVHTDRYKYLDKTLSDQLETAYQHCIRENETHQSMNAEWVVKIDHKIEVDFKTGQMTKPHKRKIRRSYLHGLWLQMRTSPSQNQIHAKINRLQIDNQLYDCIFPVVLAPVPPPKSVTANETIKPFIEVSIVQLLMKNSQILQFKYFKVLVQEFHIKLDIGFVNAIVEFFAQGESTAEQEKQQFLTDKEHVGESLYSLASNKSIQQQKSFYDLLHFSPFKIHISFTLATAGSESSDTLLPPFINVLLQGLGVTLTDMNDVVFRLAFFERNYTFLTQNQLISEATSHYVGQFIKQFYVLVLGLDVLGNPYGLVLGITKGFEDLFYEPFQGAIQGPGEFVEGLALGVKSLFGHTVGGAAGAVSKITGAMGKGIAVLTFDEDYQRKRREQKNRKPTTAQEGLARSGKGVVMGFYSGVTGVFTKPVEGAKEDGVEGFFKGLGKGAMGLVTRPVAGVVDFASESFDAVKRAAEGNDDATRLRTPRFLESDGLVRPYNKYEAQGNKYLHNLSKGKYAKTDVYVAHYDVIQHKEVLLLTNQRIAYITHSDMFGGWQVEWQYTWDEITMPAKVAPKGVVISTSDKRKKLFGSKEFAKMVLIANPKTREEICEKIESLRMA